MLKEMRIHNEPVVRNAYEVIMNRDIPIFVIGKDISEHKHLKLEDESCYFYAEYDKLSKLAGAVYLNEVFIADYLLSGSAAPCTVASSSCDDGYSKTFGPHDRLYAVIAHEVNHILNRCYTVDDDALTYQSYFSKMNALSQSAREFCAAKDEYHAYTTAQGNILGMSDNDIKKTIVSQLNCQVDWNAITLDWNITNQEKHIPPATMADAVKAQEDTTVPEWIAQRSEVSASEDGEVKE